MIAQILDTLQLQKPVPEPGQVDVATKKSMSPKGDQLIQLARQIGDRLEVHLSAAQVVAIRICQSKL